ncbi:MAG: hypothetical protein GEV13_13805 [Rhodospirillales bacterium]|nr:hypothetical protein [Rhodospirillales bacterium]
MAAATDSTADTSVDLHDAIRLIAEAGDDPATEVSLDAPDPSQDRAPDPASPDPASPKASQDSASRTDAPLSDLPPEARKASEGGSAEGEDAVPDFWADDDKPAWAKVPAELRPVLRKYEQQRLDFVAEKTRVATEERDEAMRVAQGANAIVEQAADWWRKNGQAFHQAFVDRWARVDWKTLAEKDPAEVGRLMQQRQEEETLLAEATRRGEADIAAAEAQAEKELEEARRVESAKLAAKLPEWFGTPQVAQRTWDDLRRYLFAKGVAADRIAAVREAPIVEIALNAMRFENARALADAARQRSRHGTEAVRSGQPAAEAAPARVSPGPANRPVDRASDAVRQVSDRFRRSGGASIADAAELIRLSEL